MSKRNPSLELEARTYSTYSEWSFYRPHDRARTAFTGELVCPVTGTITSPPSRTKQEFKDQCDINNIIKAYKITGQINHISANAAKGMYADLPDETDYQTALNVQREAATAFASLPSQVRDRFDNDPAEFLAFMGDPANQDEMIKLGLATDNRPPPPVAPVPDPKTD
jgi:phage internal scaffolding protein